jgi:hypothetical protein
MGNVQPQLLIINLEGGRHTPMVSSRLTPHQIDGQTTQKHSLRTACDLNMPVFHNEGNKERQEAGSKNLRFSMKKGASTST